MDSFRAKIGCIILVIIILMIYKSGKSSSDTQYCMDTISGMWEADPGFCQEADLDRFNIYLDTTSSRCWILICTESEVICNHITTFSLTSNYSSLFEKKESQDFKKYYITFKDLPKGLYENNIFPKVQTLKIYPTCGKISLTDADAKRICFAGYKDALVSDRVSLDEISPNKNEITD